MSALSSVVGTLVGFMTGAYILPMSLPQIVVDIMNVLPFTPAAMLVRGFMAEPALEVIGLPGGHFA
ncbi:putative membrane protein [Corynebacterium deserti GIMN1.010]|uniref:Putative membrane protein n=2 Tax=Corynebacterium TaxID=1716 RepID=A0A0M4CQM0_9CORY|nr:putative membrane protein [Corynebacterium deserti GIMN1.010]